MKIFNSWCILSHSKSETTTYYIFLSDGYANCKWVKLDKWEQNFEWLGSFAEGSLLDLTFEMQKLKDQRKDFKLSWGRFFFVTLTKLQISYMS